VSELTVIAKATARPGSEHELERELRASIPPSHEEPGCLRFALHRSSEDPAVFVAVERWASKEAWDEHMAAPHIKRVMETTPALMAGPPEVQVLEALPEGDPAKGL
jgi:quinol monooxygenase YgiN